METTCPFCGEPTEIDVEVDLEDASPGAHTFVQDCDVCCRPISVRLRIGADGSAQTDTDRD